MMQQTAASEIDHRITRSLVMAYPPHEIADQEQRADTGCQSHSAPNQDAIARTLQRRNYNEKCGYQQQVSHLAQPGSISARTQPRSKLQDRP
jgi:hypothetical protein